MTSRQEQSRPSWSSLQRRAAEELGDDAAARWFVEEASGGPWSEVAFDPAPLRGERALSAMVARRLRGEPVQYVLGHWAFRSLDLMVDGRALIPRPETEVVVEVALAELDRQVAAADDGGAGGPWAVADLGTGSGAIALSIAAERPATSVWATDISPGALDVASANLAGLGARAAGRVRLVLGDWWAALPEQLAGGLALAVSNPPYVSEGELDSLPAEVADWEPSQALVSGPSGLEALERLLAGAPRWLSPGGALVAEIAPHRAYRAVDLAERAGLVDVSVKTDLAGRERALVGRRW